MLFVLLKLMFLMAGFNLYTKFSDLNSTVETSTELFFESSSINLSVSGSENGYFQQAKYPDFSVFFDGQVYNTQVAILFDECIKAARGNTLHELTEFVKTIDGEFVLILIESGANRAWLINDSFGRLPIYIYEHPEQLIITRNIDWLVDVINLPYNKTGLAQLLLFGYCLGTRTHFDSIRKMSPNSLLSIDCKPLSIKEASAFSIDLKNNNLDLEVLENELQSAFEKALLNRINTLGNAALALSGGLDSRYIASVLKKLDVNIPLITYRDVDHSTDLDIESAQKISQQLGLEEAHQFIQLDKCMERDLQELARHKQGFNSLSMAFQLSFWKHFSEHKFSILTGDGGGKFFVDLSPLKTLHSEKKLLRYILRYNAISTPEVASTLAGISKNELLKSVTQELRAYPYSDFDQKYIYFTIREGGINWAFEGEDRNRLYTWSTSPFYAPEVIRLAMRYPMKQKIYGGLYRRLYAKLPGKLNEVLNPNWNEAPGSVDKVRRLHKRQSLKLYLPQRLIWRKKSQLLCDFPEYNLFKKQVELTNEFPKLNHLKGRQQNEFYWIILTLLLRRNQ